MLDYTFQNSDLPKVVIYFFSYILFAGVFCAIGRTLLVIPGTAVQLSLWCCRLVNGYHTAAATHAATTVPNVSSTAAATATKHLETSCGRFDQRAVRGCTVGPRLSRRRLLVHMAATGLCFGRHIVSKKVSCTVPCYNNHKTIVLTVKSSRKC